MDLIAALAERKILEAMERGEFDDLPGKGKPLDLSDDPMVPDDLRVAYKILKNSGCLPPELELHKEIVRLRDLIQLVARDVHPVGNPRTETRRGGAVVIRQAVVLA